MGEGDGESGAEDATGEAPSATADSATETDAERAKPLDGVLIADGTVPVLDGMAVLGAEPRTPEDVAAFQLPPAGYDPYMFRIEPEPLRDRRPAELFLIE
ncbi:MAG TPA: hypothetical protein VFR19_07965, partial [Hyphomicrobiaceae bacterium]|nr:hypothetical protein [Hyphomicrobiaceae bacterium]